MEVGRKEMLFLLGCQSNGLRYVHVSMPMDETANLIPQNHGAICQYERTSSTLDGVGGPCGIWKKKKEEDRFSGLINGRFLLLDHFISFQCALAGKGMFHDRQRIIFSYNTIHTLLYIQWHLPGGVDVYIRDTL